MKAIISTLTICACLVGFSQAHTIDEEPRYFGAQKGSLLETQKRIQNQDQLLYPAYQRLIADADKAMKVKPLTVTDKITTAISADIHDYYSTAPYLWPDPTKPDGLPYVPRDGQINPEARNPLHTDQMRIRDFGQLVESLTLAYYFSGEKKYAEKAATMLRVWYLNEDTQMNPNMNYGQAVPGLTPGRAIGIIEGSAIIYTADAASLLKDYEGWTDNDQEGLDRWLNEYLDWLLTSDHGRLEGEMKQNHGSKYDASVARLALVLGRNDLAKSIINDVKMKRILLQIEPDGAQPMELRRTKGFNYSLFNLEALIQLADLGTWIDVDLWNYETDDGRSIVKAIEFVRPYVEVLPENVPPAVWHYEQIVPIQRVKAAPIFRKAANAKQDSSYEVIASQFSELKNRRLQLLYPAQVM
ncbi:alginate lyase family protein [Vibrio sp. FNV 38]|nr:alginate lyase family protein [Vibrio sp. FNV 38]